MGAPLRQRVLRGRMRVARRGAGRHGRGVTRDRRRAVAAGSGSRGGQPCCYFAAGPHGGHRRPLGGGGDSTSRSTQLRRSGIPGSNRRHSAWEADALPTELIPRGLSYVLIPSLSQLVRRRAWVVDRLFRLTLRRAVLGLHTPCILRVARERQLTVPADRDHLAHRALDLLLSDRAEGSGGLGRVRAAELGPIPDGVTSFTVRASGCILSR